MRVVVVGAGLAGLCTAYYLCEAQADVTILERAGGPALGTSFANGALLHPSMAEPWNSPDILGTLLRYVGREHSPILLRPSALPRLLWWAMCFLRYSERERFETNALTNLRLALYSLQQFRELRLRTRLEYGNYRRGTLAVHRDRGGYSRALRWAARLERHGLAYEALTADEAVAREPALAPVASQLRGAIYHPDDEGGNAYLFCDALARHLQASGLRIVYGANVKRLEVADGTVIAALDDSGQRYAADRFVLAAGSLSSKLASTVGLSLPVHPVKGYSITVSLNVSPHPTYPVFDKEARLAAVPLHGGRLRVAGMAEFAGYDTDPTPARISSLVHLLGNLYPRIAAGVDFSEVSPWAGLRPVCVDGVPLIGPTKRSNLLLNTGHGHLGWTLAAGAGRLTADQVLERPCDLNPAPYHLARFTR